MDKEKEKEAGEERVAIKPPPPEAATAVLSANSQLLIKDQELTKEELVSEYARRLSIVLPVVKRLKKNQLIRILANTLAPPWLLPLKNYELKDEFEVRVSRLVAHAVDAQLALAEFLVNEQELLNEGDTDGESTQTETKDNADEKAGD